MQSTANYGERTQNRQGFDVFYQIVSDIQKSEMVQLGDCIGNGRDFVAVEIQLFERGKLEHWRKLAQLVMTPTMMNGMGCMCYRDNFRNEVRFLKASSGIDSILLFERTNVFNSVRRLTNANDSSLFPFRSRHFK